MSAWLQGVWLSLPVIFGGITHVIAIKKNIFPSLTRRRLDAGLTLRGRDLFGANKTVRGAVVMTLATVFWAVVFDGLQVLLGVPETIRYIPMERLNSVGLGALLGGAYILGELPNSFIKRQLDIQPGGAAGGRIRGLFWLIDQLDSSVSILLILSLVRPPDSTVYLVILGLTVFVHPAVAALMVALGLKQRVG